MQNQDRTIRSETAAEASGILTTYKIFDSAGREPELEKNSDFQHCKTLQTEFDATGVKLGPRKCLTAHFEARSELFPAIFFFFFF
jgi:hypothetical protein